MSLFGQHGKFIEYYLANNFDAVAAAKAAGYKLKNISQNAWKILDNPKIIKGIREEVNKRSQRFQVDKIFVLANFIKIINICLATYIDEDGIECFKFPTLVDKGLKCTEKVGKHLGMFGHSADEKVVLPEISLVIGVDKDDI